MVSGGGNFQCAQEPGYWQGWLQPKSASVRMERWGGDQLGRGRGIQRGGEVTVLTGAAR